MAFLALHGRFGEDGAIQGILEWLGIPYTGSGVLSSALSLDKLKAKELFRLHNIPTPPYYDLNGPVSDAQIEDRHGSFGFPVMVKPRREGSPSACRARTTWPSSAPPSTRPSATTTASSWSATSVPARCTSPSSATACWAPSRWSPSAPSTITRPSTPRASASTTSPRASRPTRYQGVLRLAERAHHALGCTGATRVNLLVTEGENEYVLEVNTLPGLTATSLLPKIAAGAGLDFPSLCEEILRGARLHSRAGVDRSVAREAGADVASPSPRDLGDA